MRIDGERAHRQHSRQISEATAELTPEGKPLTQDMSHYITVPIDANGVIDPDEKIQEIITQAMSAAFSVTDVFIYSHGCGGPPPTPRSKITILRQQVLSTSLATRATPGERRRCSRS